MEYSYINVICVCGHHMACHTGYGETTILGSCNGDRKQCKCALFISRKGEDESSTQGEGTLSHQPNSTDE